MLSLYLTMGALLVLCRFIGVGAIGGMLGVGAGWANVLVLVGVMGRPVKMAAATSGLIIYLAEDRTSAPDDASLTAM